MRLGLAFAVVFGCAAAAAPARAQPARRAVTFHFAPTVRAQIAIWLESADGTRFATARLTDAVARRGIGNRPGASQMNSGYHWPYGRREGVLPVWAHRRASAPGTVAFPRVIFQKRPEGHADRNACDDSTRDSYFCLSFALETTRRDGLDAISCASVFNGDKGRFITASDVAGGYSEPSDLGLRALGEGSLYPPRRDVVSCASATSPPNSCMGGSSPCNDHPDSALYADRARAAMPEIDAVTMATPPGEQPAAITFDLPLAWPDGDYFAFLEINTEGDYNASYNAAVYPTPMSSDWDSWAMSYGYPFRGQPSVVFRLAIQNHNGRQTWSTDVAYGYGSLSGVGPQGGAITPIDATISNDAAAAPGSGVDRLRVTSQGYRLRVDLGAPPPPDAGADADGAATDAGGDAGDTPAGPDAGGSGSDAGGPAPPLCIPGMTVACACVGGEQGAQTCASDGNRFEMCQCPQRLSMRKGCDCDCNTGDGAGGPLGIALLAALLLVRRRRSS